MIAIDIGYSSVKGLNSAGQRVYFPSVIAPASENLLNGALPGGIEHHVKDSQGREYWVGEAALQSSCAVSTLSRKSRQRSMIYCRYCGLSSHAEEGILLRLVYLYHITALSGRSSAATTSRE